MFTLYYTTSKLSSESSTSRGFFSAALSRFLPRPTAVPNTVSDPESSRADPVDTNPVASTSGSTLISTATHALSTVKEVVDTVIETVKEVVELPIVPEDKDASDQEDQIIREEDKMAKSSKKYDVKAEPKREDDLSDIDDDESDDDQEYEVEAILDMRKSGVSLSLIVA